MLTLLFSIFIVRVVLGLVVVTNITFMLLLHRPEEYNKTKSQIMSSETPVTEYKHRPLPDKSWIRLIKIHPHVEDNHLSCALQHFITPSKTCPDYVALSYLWGDPTPTHTIYINGLPRKIHTNLWLFLRRAWTNGETAWFWVDSLCLDLDSHPELNVQVAHMGDIYARAAHVVSWLGESEGGVDALNIMADFLALTPTDDTPGMNPLDMHTTAGQRLDRAWTHLTRLEGCEYWQRVWVLQEVACAKVSSVVYGPIALDLEQLLLCPHLDTLYQSWATGTQKDPYSVAGEWMSKLVGLRRQLKIGERTPLLELIERLSGASCTREVDRVYGLVGLCCRLNPDFDPKSLEIDYDKSLEHVAWDLILLTIESTPSCLWEGLHRTMYRAFKTLRVYRDRTAPPRDHHKFLTTSTNRAVRTQRITQLYEAVIASGYVKSQWEYSLQAGEEVQEWSLHHEAGNAATEVMDHVGTCRPETRQGFRDTACADNMIGLSLIVCATKVVREPIDKPQPTEETSKRLPRLCAVHLPEHLRKIVYKLKPVTKAMINPHSHTTPCCEGGTTNYPCDSLTVYLEIPELGLVVQSVSKGAVAEGWGCPVHIQWFCTRCPTFSDSDPHNNQVDGSTLPSLPSKATRISVIQKTIHNSWGRPF